MIGTALKDQQCNTCSSFWPSDSIGDVRDNYSMSTALAFQSKIDISIMRDFAFLSLHSS